MFIYVYLSFYWFCDRTFKRDHAHIKAELSTFKVEFRKISSCSQLLLVSFAAAFWEVIFLFCFSLLIARLGESTRMDVIVQYNFN